MTYLFRYAGWRPAPVAAPLYRRSLAPPTIAMTPPSSKTPIGDWFHTVEARVHRRSLALLDLTEAEREEQVHLMLANRQRGVVEYWTFLMLSMGIATLGLVMDSTTVVIGAMLVSPLMGPIVEFAMGLVVGSPVLTVRSVLRILGSVVLVVVGTALMTLVLPFREITGEIAARTEPTLMDLALAVLVALAAALTVVKARSETNIVAAGAAIGIALIPPICVIGYGLGVGQLEIASGASLLLVTNFTAIIFIGVVFFYLLGYERVDVRVWDDEAVAAAPAESYLRRVLLVVDRIFGSRRSRLFRVLVPGMVFGLLALPLTRALDRVSWEVRARTAVMRILSELPGEQDYFETSHSVANGRIAVRTYVVASDGARTDSLRNALATRIAAATGVEPDVRVVAVPNYRVMRRVMEAMETADRERDPAPELHLSRMRQDLAAALQGAWPGDDWGPLVGWNLLLSDAGTLDLHLHHAGPVLDPGAARVLAAALGPRAPEGLRVRFSVVDTSAVRAVQADALRWLPALARRVNVASAAPRARLCVTLPDDASLRSGAGTARAVAELVPDLLSALPGDRFHLTETGDDFVVRVVPESSAPGADVPPTGPVPEAGGERTAEGSINVDGRAGSPVPANLCSAGPTDGTTPADEPRSGEDG